MAQKRVWGPEFTFALRAGKERDAIQILMSARSLKIRLIVIRMFVGNTELALTRMEVTVRSKVSVAFCIGNKIMKKGFDLKKSFDHNQKAHNAQCAKRGVSAA